MRAILLVLLLFQAPMVAALAAQAVDQAATLDRPPVLAPGQAPPLPMAGPLAEPRSSAQAGFPAALTASVVPPAT